MTAGDRDVVAGLLGRQPRGFEVVVRDRSGAPVVISNPPILEDATPMPTRYWLVSRQLRAAVSRLESAGGVREAEAAVDPLALASAHERYAAGRARELPPGYEGAVPSGGVGGTRRGVKCLHAHLAWYLAGGDDPVGRWVAERLDLDLGELVWSEAEGGPGNAVAAIDCGTNSTRLLISGHDGASLERRMRITRLGEGVDRSGELQAAAIDRTLRVLREYAGAMAGAGVGRRLGVATSAIRDAANAAAFLEPAAGILGGRLSVLSGGEEGRLSYRGATSELGGAGPCLVVDVGGGSTELVAEGGGTVEVVSLDIGCVRVTERFLRSDPPTVGELEAARAHVARLVEGAGAAHPSFAQAGLLVGLAGTVSALTMLSLGLTSYDRSAVHHARLSRAEVSRLLGELAAVDVATRRARPGMEHDRADVIVGGALVLATVMDVLGFEELVVSESDILDGIVAELLTG